MMADDFDTFWSAYPRKIAKGDARKAWAKMARVMPPIGAILVAIADAKDCEQWRREGGAFIPYPATWLRQERWSDEHVVEIEKPLNKAAEHGRSAADAERKRVIVGLTGYDPDTIEGHAARID